MRPVKTVGRQNPSPDRLRSLASPLERSNLAQFKINTEELLMSISLSTIILILLILMLLGAIPSWPHSRSWGYGPSGALGTLVIVVLILVVLGRI